ncbi:MAG: RluA family pseudouridine synthase [Lachnospiraceae bacterium]|nr:RluA family pseudouridine synthase [Lachnospiraceae bacterium]
MKILYEDNDILVCEKEAGLPTQSASVRSADLVSQIRQHLNGAYLGIVHRLDTPVSGLLVFAKTKKAAASLSKQAQESALPDPKAQGHGMHKQYLATVEGLVEKSAPVILTDYLIKDGKNNMAVIVSEGRRDAQGKPAKCAKLSYEVLSYDEKTDTTTLNIRLLTGRFHQIRAQLSHMGHPIVGDVKYGAANKKPAASKETAGIALCAYDLTFVHPATGELMHFQIPNSSL